jgi:hypothetical protein
MNTTNYTESHLKHLNAFYHELSPWQLTLANKAHVDEMGDKIQAGSQYYSNGDFNPAKQLRLSEKSMEGMLRCLFQNSLTFEGIGKKVHAKRVAEGERQFLETPKELGY